MLDLAHYIQALGLGTMGTDVFIGVLPKVSSNVPGRCCALFEEAALEPAMQASGITQWETPDVTIVFRDVTYVVARLWAERVYQRFLALANTRIGPTPLFYRTLGVRTTPYYDGLDASGMPIIAFSLSPQKILSQEAWL